MRKDEILNDLEKFFRMLCQKKFILEKEENSDAQTLLCPSRALIPFKRRDTALETYIKQSKIDVECQLEELQDKRCKECKILTL